MTEMASSSYNSGRHCTFQPRWLDPTLCPDFSDWVRRVTNNSNAVLCILCNKTIDISSMGEAALRSHSKGVKHKTLEDEQKTASRHLSTLSTFLRPPPQVQTVEHVQDAPRVPSRGHPTVAGFVIDEATRRAEMGLILRTVYYHQSYTSCETLSDFYKSIFPDSTIANSVKLGRDKMAYNIAFGIAPYLQNSVVGDIGQGKYVICFDEALNHQTQTEQLDMTVKYWDVKISRIATRYFNSVFLNRTRATDLLRAFKEQMLGLPLSNMVQIGMDGPIGMDAISPVPRDGF